MIDENYYIINPHRYFPQKEYVDNVSAIEEAQRQCVITGQEVFVVKCVASAAPTAAYKKLMGEK